MVSEAAGGVGGDAVGEPGADQDRQQGRGDQEDGVDQQGEPDHRLGVVPHRLDRAVQDVAEDSGRRGMIPGRWADIRPAAPAGAAARYDAGPYDGAAAATGPGATGPRPARRARRRAGACRRWLVAVRRHLRAPLVRVLGPIIAHHRAGVCPTAPSAGPAAGRGPSRRSGPAGRAAHRERERSHLVGRRERSPSGRRSTARSAWSPASWSCRRPAAGRAGSRPTPNMRAPSPPMRWVRTNALRPSTVAVADRGVERVDLAELRLVNTRCRTLESVSPGALAWSPGSRTNLPATAVAVRAHRPAWPSRRGRP